MTRLPTPGGDDGTWGEILNSFLSVSLNTDGSINTNSLVQAGAITSINSLKPSNGSITLQASDVGALTQSNADLRYTQISNLGQKDGIATLDSSGNVPIAQLSNVPSPPVTSVNSKTGAVNLTYTDVGADPAGAAAQAQANSLPLAGGTMSGNLDMANNKITAVSNGTSASDVATYGQIPTSLPPSGSAGGDLSGNYPNPTVSTINGKSVIANLLPPQIITTSQNVTVPNGVGHVKVFILGPGSGGSGGGSASAGGISNQAGGGGGSAGTNSTQIFAVSPGDILELVIGVGSAGGLGGAAGGNPGTQSPGAGNSSLSINGSLTMLVQGGMWGSAPSLANSSTVQAGGVWGVNSGAGSNIPGSGAVSSGYSEQPLYGISVWGGCGGGSATATNGAGAATPPTSTRGGGPGTSGGSSTSSAVNTPNTTAYGCGGCGGGGGAPGGSGGSGGNGGPGLATIEWMA